MLNFILAFILAFTFVKVDEDTFEKEDSKL